MIIVAAPVARAMRQQAVATYPEECCGLLVGRREADGSVLVARAVTAPNVAPFRRRRFEIDPAVRFRLMRELRGSDDVMVGHYHSHPDHPAEPSATDLAMAFEPDLMWLIVAVTVEGAGRIAAFQPRPVAGRFLPLPLQIGDSADRIGND